MQAMGNGAYSCNLKRKPVYQNPRSEACSKSRPSSLHTWLKGIHQRVFYINQCNPFQCVCGNLQSKAQGHWAKQWEKKKGKEKKRKGQT